jgi:hypothetical protein
MSTNIDETSLANVINLKGLQLKTSEKASSDQIYPSITGTSYSPDVDYINALSKLMAWLDANGASNIMLGKTTPITKTELMNSLIMNPASYARTYLDGKFNEEFEKFYMLRCNAVQTNPHIPYQDCEMFIVQQTIINSFSKDHRDSFTPPTPEQIQAEPDMYGPIDIFDTLNIWRDLSKHNFMKLNNRFLTFETPALEQSEADYVHLSEDQLMEKLKKYFMVDGLHTAITNHNKLVIDKLKIIRPQLTQAIYFFQHICKDSSGNHSPQVMQLVNDFQFAEAFSTFMTERNDSIKNHSDSLHRITKNYWDFTWDDRIHTSFTQFFTTLKHIQSSIWMMHQSLEPAIYDPRLNDRTIDHATLTPLVPLTINEMQIALHTMSDEEFRNKHPGRCMQFNENIRLSGLFFRLRFESKKWPPIVEKFEVKYPRNCDRTMNAFLDFLKDHFNCNQRDHYELNNTSHNPKIRKDDSREPTYKAILGTNHADLAHTDTGRTHTDSGTKAHQECKACSYWKQTCSRRSMSYPKDVPGGKMPNPNDHDYNHCQWRYVADWRQNISEENHPLGKNTGKPLPYSVHNQLYKIMSEEEVNTKINNWRNNNVSDKRSRTDDRSTESRPKQSYRTSSGSSNNQTQRTGGGSKPTGSGPNQTYRTDGGSSNKQTYRTGGGSNNYHQGSTGSGPNQTYRTDDRSSNNQTYRTDDRSSNNQTYRTDGGSSNNQTYRTGGGSNNKRGRWNDQANMAESSSSSSNSSRSRGSQGNERNRNDSESSSPVNQCPDQTESGDEESNNR